MCFSAPTSRIQTVVSSDAEASKLPSDENEHHLTDPECVLNSPVVCVHVYVFAFNRHAFQSFQTLIWTIILALACYCNYLTQKVWYISMHTVYANARMYIGCECNSTNKCECH